MTEKDMSTQAATDHSDPPMAQRLIGRLPSNQSPPEIKAPMNCKSCRKRKIKCNRLQPCCAACKVFKVNCIYDTVPQKRGPKPNNISYVPKAPGRHTDRDGLSNATGSGPQETTQSVYQPQNPPPNEVVNGNGRKRPLDGLEAYSDGARTNPPSPPLSLSCDHPQRSGTMFSMQCDVSDRSSSSPALLQPRQTLLDVYFATLHCRPYYVLDPATTKSQHGNQQLSVQIIDAIHAVTAIHAVHILSGYESAVNLREESSTRARLLLDTDEPTIENLQTCLLLSEAYLQAGKGKKSYMLLSSALTMALALELHRELPEDMAVPMAERQARRKLFWTCYLMDRFAAIGSNRPCILSEETVQLRLPDHNEDDFQSSLRGLSCSGMRDVGNESSHTEQGAFASLVEVTRILYVACRHPSVDAPSHRPNSSSPSQDFSNILQDVNRWADRYQAYFIPMEDSFSQAGATRIILARLIYHAIHCLLYRHLLPLHLNDWTGVEGDDDHRLEALKVCFSHADAIMDLVESCKSGSDMAWPAFTALCLFTAGTVHVQGSHYVGPHRHIYTRSAQCVPREIAYLDELRCVYIGVQHQWHTLRVMQQYHGQMILYPMGNMDPQPSRRDFFDRYSGYNLETAHVVVRDTYLAQTPPPTHPDSGTGSPPPFCTYPRTDLPAAAADDVLSSFMPTEPLLSPSSYGGGAPAVSSHADTTFIHHHHHPVTTASTTSTSTMTPPSFSPSQALGPPYPAAPHHPIVVVGYAYSGHDGGDEYDEYDEYDDYGGGGGGGGVGGGGRGRDTLAATQQQQQLRCSSHPRLAAAAGWGHDYFAPPPLPPLPPLLPPSTTTTFDDRHDAPWSVMDVLENVVGRPRMLPSQPAR